MPLRTPKDILYVTRPLCPPWDEGSKNFSYNLSKHIHGANIHIMTCGTLPKMPSTVIQHPVYSKSAFTTSQKLRSLFYQKFHTRDHDVAHYFFTPSKLNAFFTKKFLKRSNTFSIQTVATIRDDILSEKDLKEIIFGDYVITYTKYSKQRLESMGFGNVIEISPGIDLNKFAPQQKDIRTLQQLKIYRSEYIVTFVGEFVRNGGVDYITDTLIEYFKRYPESPMHFVYGCRTKPEHGDVAKKEETIKKLTDAGIVDKVTFTDIIFNVKDLYNISDLVLYPVKDLKGKFDIPLVIPEVMACEKPIVLSDIPQLSEFTQTNISARVGYGDIQRLIQEIEQHRHDPESGKAMGRRARDYVLNRFSIHRIAEKYSELYQNI